MQEPLDFERSMLFWRTKFGSNGYWRIIASATLADNEGKAERYVLAAQVMAGDVYGSGRLPLDPPYSFQIYASRNEHVILREPVLGHTLRDSRASNGDVFEAIEVVDRGIRLERVEFDALSDIENVWPLTVRLSTRTRDGALGCLVDFPVMHANTQQSDLGFRFHIETGPILVPTALFKPSQATVEFSLAHVLFNQLSRVDLLLWEEHVEKNGRGRAFWNYQRLENVALEFYRASSRTG